MSDPLFNTAITNPFGLSHVGFSANPTLADIDGDGDLDAFIGNEYGNTVFYQNYSGPQKTDSSLRWCLS